MPGRSDRAFRQYDAIDPENRLVAAELEQRWNRALARVDDVEARIAAHDLQARRQPGVPTVSFTTLAADLPVIWRAPTTDAQLKKRIVRLVVEEVVADIDAEAGEIGLFVHWVGGVHTELRLPRRRRGQRNSTSPDVIEAVRLLVRIASDDVIAGILNRNKLVTGHGNRWTRERVTALRSHYKIPVLNAGAVGQAEWLNLTKAADHLHVSAKTLRSAAETGEIPETHPLPDGPWLFSRIILESEAAKWIVLRAKQGTKHPTGPAQEQKTLFDSTT